MIRNLIEKEYLGKILEKLEKSNRVNVSGVSGSFSAIISSAIAFHTKKKVLIITRDELRAKELSEDLFFLADKNNLHFLEREPVFYDIEGAGTDLMHKRLEVMQQAIGDNYSVIVASISAIMLKIPSKIKFIENIIKIKIADTYKIDTLMENLINCGYTRTDKVSISGEFSKRGSILDVFPINLEVPVRLDFFGDDVDSIKTFDPVSQRSSETLDSCEIIQAIEYSMNNIDRSRVISELESMNQDFLEKDIEKLKNGFIFPSMDKYLKIIYKNPASFIEYMPEDSIIIYENELSIEKVLDEKIKEYYDRLKNIDPVFDMSYFYKISKSFSKIDLYPLDIIDKNAINIDNIEEENVSYRIKRINDYRESTSMFFDKIKELKAKKYKIVVLTTGLTHGNKLVDELSKEGLDAGFIKFFRRPVEKGEIVILEGNIHESIEIEELHLAILSENIFIPHKKKRKIRPLDKKGKIRVFTELKKGDFVVHYSHGIGRYEGLESLTVEGIKKDYLKIIYKDDDSIFIPVNQVDLISKYIGNAGKVPKLSKLGGIEWSKAKTRVKSALKDIAKDLITLYSQREKIKGYAYAKDTVWQKEFEEEFQYEETDDQIRSVQEIKRDMETNKPMERLLCGDVGYGKTEVALRAVFKAAIEGKQVAFLVPTTILAQQHYQTFTERLRNYPINVDVISRFRSKRSQKLILENLEKGKLDVLIGTHRLLSKDSKFKNLGLLVIDEEQRFGVEHKEKIKTLFPGVDVLTLTATPIPRTLHMSLSGIRDISIIEQPPEARYPVQTYVFEYNDEIIKSAIRRELGRGGQVFYLSNRVSNIEIKAAKIRQLIGEKANIAIAHGQMNETKLENILQEFIKGEYSILVCTTIIEAGIDMPNVNTIIVEDADRMGLSQLYQLRGRVGRSNKQAYAYITTKSGKSITETAEKRLEAIREFTDFGAGFKIAMRDMEIRGAGNLLGSQQHGQLESVGYDMYCKLLNEAVMELKGDFIERNTVETLVDIKVNAFIPDSYINVEYQKIDLYKKIALITDEADFLEVEDELIDRFGDIPIETYNLMNIAYIKNTASRHGIINVIERDDGCILEFSKEIGINIELFKSLHKKYERNILLNAGMKPHLFLKIPSEAPKKLENIKFLLRDIKTFVEQ